MSHLPTDRPTDQPTDRPEPYYQYRLTVKHTEVSLVREFLKKYSKDWALFCMHNPDGEDSQEHFHMVMRDFTQKTVDAFRKAVSKHFSRSGNGLHSGKFQTNHVSKAIGYFKHDPDAEIYHSGQDYWQEYIETEPAFVKSQAPKVLFKETKSHPALTYGNVLKQALKYRQEQRREGLVARHLIDNNC